ncbi:MAG TPA: CHRD domain-containing protein [Candidatus Limnocylindria bacterium]|nr:CHRD domain-containing protein [Candidatus Limnocylindria bacterium]
MRKFAMAFITVVLTFGAMAGSAAADKPPASTFIAVLNSDNETGACAGISNSARGVAIFHVTDEATGTVEWRLVANNLPGTPVAAHIHIGPPGVPGPVVQPLTFPAGNENGVIGTGTFTNPALLAAIRADPGNYYVNVHTAPNCPGGVIRGQLGDHGP